MNRIGPILLATIAVLALAAMAASLLGRDWLYDLYWYWWVPLAGLVSLCLLIRQTRRLWLLALVPFYLLPLGGLLYFNAVCGQGGGSCI